MRFVLAFCLIGTPALAENTLACVGWSVDRVNLGNMIRQQHDLRAALRDIPKGDPGYELSSLLVRNLSTLIDAAERASAASGNVYKGVCPSSP